MFISLGLDGGSKHYICVVITSLVYDFFFSFSLTDLAPTSPLSNVAITRRGSGSVEVSWTPLSLTEARGFPKYVVSYISEDGSMTGTVESTNSSVVISGLHPQFGYIFTVYASTGNGHGLPTLSEL